MKFKTVDEYAATLPKKVKRIMEQLRKTIKQVAPGAEELISYNMPAFKLNGMLVYYAAWKEHIGFYPASSQIRKLLKKELSVYEGGKGTLKFPIDKPLPVDLITKIVKFRVEENKERAEAKLKKKK